MPAEPETNSEVRNSGDFSWRSEFYAWSVVGLLILAFTFSMIDRMLLTLLVDPIKEDFQLSDTQVSLLHGLAFTLLYVIAGLPMGRLTDKYSRRAIAGFSVFAWSLATAACGLASSFVQLFLGRVGVGVGEAGLSPSANSLIADYFPADRLAKPITYFSIGGSAGAGLAYIFGGAVVDFVAGLGNLDLPLIGEIRPWQAAFFVVGLPGVLIALLFLFVREPARQGAVGDVQEDASFGQALGFLGRHIGFFSTHFAAAALVALAVLSVHAWMPSFLIRKYSLTPGEAGLGYGLVVIVGGISGLLTSGYLADKLADAGREGSHILVAMWYTLIAILPTALATQIPSLPAALILAGIGVFGFASAIAISPVALQILVPNRMRGVIYAIYLLTISILGYTIGPILVALLTDYVFSNEAMVGASITIVVLGSAPLAAILYARSRALFTALVERNANTETGK